MGSVETILVADGEEAFRHSACQFLCNSGFACEGAEDSGEALEHIRRRRFGLMIADARLPPLADLRLVQAAREIDEQMPIILVSGRASPQTVIQSVELAIAGYLAKPVHFEELLWHVHAAIAHSRNRRAVNAIRGRLQSCLLDLDHARSVTHAAGMHGLVSLGTIRTLAASLSELLDLCLCGSQGTTHNLCELLDCRKHPSCREAMADAVEVLKRTKDLFKSKALAELRTRFENLLEPRRPEREAAAMQESTRALSFRFDGPTAART